MLDSITDKLVVAVIIVIIFGLYHGVFPAAVMLWKVFLKKGYSAKSQIRIESKEWVMRWDSLLYFSSYSMLTGFGFHFFSLFFGPKIFLLSLLYPLLVFIVIAKIPINDVEKIYNVCIGYSKWAHADVSIKNKHLQRILFLSKRFCDIYLTIILVLLMLILAFGFLGLLI